MKYLNTKPGSIEELAVNMAKHQNESGYQDMFKKELEKAGKGIGSMTPAEKKAFFNKVDSKYTAKGEAVDNPYAVGMAQAMKAKDDQPPLKKSTITKAHDIAKSIEKDQKESVEMNEADITFYDLDSNDPSFKKLVRDNNLTVKSKRRGYKGDTITISGSNSSIEKALKTMYGNDWRKVYKQQGSKYIEAQFKKDIKEEDAYQNDRFAVSGNSAKIDNANTRDKSNHIYAPNAKTAVAMYKAGVKSYKDTTDMRKKFPMAVEEVINEIGSFSKIYTKKSMGSHPSKKAEDVFYKGLVQSINVGLRGKPPKRDTFIGIIGRDGSRYYAQGINRLGGEALGLHSNRQDALKAVFDYSVKSKQIQERAVGGEKKTFKEVYKKTKKEAMNTTGDATVDNANQNLEPTEKPENDPDVKVAKKKTDVGSKTTGVDTSPEIAYKN